MTSLARSSRLLALPAELRLEIYKAILPRGTKIHVGERPTQHWASAGDSYNAASQGVTVPLMLTCKRFHVEVTEFIFSHNSIVVAQPVRNNLFLTKLGATARKFITDIEIDLESGIGDLGSAWNTMNECPRLRFLTLYCAPDKVTWRRVLAQLVQNAIPNYVKPSDPRFPEMRGVCICVELCLMSSDILGLDDEASQIDMFEQSQLWAQAHSQVFSFSTPTPVRQFLVRSADTEIAREVFASRNQADRSNGWYLERVGLPEKHFYQLTHPDYVGSALNVSQTPQNTLQTEESSQTLT